MKTTLQIVSVVLIIISQLVTGLSPTTSSSLTVGQRYELTVADEPDKLGDVGVEAEIRSAIFAAVAERGYGWGAENYQLQLDNLEISDDGDWAKAWLVYYDPTLEIVIPTEPGVVVVKKVVGEWIVYLPGEDGWKESLEAAPADLIIPAEAVLWQSQQSFETQEFPVEALTGYHLPWEKGKTMQLTGSVSHDTWITNGTAHYAFDFANGTMWPIYAAKSGYVYTYRDDIPNGTEAEPNFIVLQNADNSSLYQVYLHLAQYSIPPELKFKGAPVVQGQYIGTSDDTGMSTGHHLHFHVGGKPYWPEDNPYWSQSLDIAFQEVDIYDGRPRLSTEYDAEICGGKCILGRSLYTSANVRVGDLIPPYGDLEGINTGEVVTTSVVTLSGWGRDDDSGLDYGQLVANFDGEWHAIGSSFNPSFTYAWDLCAENQVVPDGAVSLALRLYDLSGNWEPIAGLTHFTKDYTCPIPPPSCVPAADQVTLFEDIDYTGGCARFNIGEYASGSSLGVVGGDDTASIMLGSQVAVTLYSENYYTGHSETLVGNDSYLLDNLIGANTLSSMVIAMKNQLPLAPGLVSPADGMVFTQGEVIPLSWRNGQGALEYQVTLNAQTYAWQAAPFMLLDSLPVGDYTWKVVGRNTAGTSQFSQVRSFRIDAAPPLPGQVTAPFYDDFETIKAGWTSAGLWARSEGLGIESSYAWWYQDGDDNYADGTANYGSLTSPPINIPEQGYYLTFHYRNETESNARWWDQRWVQISIGNGPFTPIYQFSEDPRIPELLATTWLKSPVIDLSDYAGQVIRVRLMFITFDEALNAFRGWGIDNFDISMTPPPVCTDVRQDDTWQEANLLVYDPDQAVAGEICPGGDWDYYKFTGSQGDRIVVDIDANETGSLLDPYLVLYNTDGKSVLAEDDDELLGLRRDPLLGYTLLQDGVYYLKIRAWNHPAVGGSTYDYQIRLFTDEDDPVASLSYPVSGQYLPDNLFTIRAQVSDAIDRISRVEFFWHSANWLEASWTSLGTDWDGSDGWNMNFDPAGQPEGRGAAIFIIAYDRAGNLTGAVSWDLGIDKAAPYTNMNYMENVQTSNAFPLRWTGSDNLSGIEYYEIQSQFDGGLWENDPGRVDGYLAQRWFVADANHEYGFRMHGVDYSGNSEEYPTTAEITATIPAANLLCASLDEFDLDEADNSPGKATPLGIRNIQTHNFCNPLYGDFKTDQDWVSFTVKHGRYYSIQVFPLDESSAVRLRLFASDGVTLIKEVEPADFGQSTQLEWIADRDSLVYLQMSHINSNVLGSVVAYNVLLREGYTLYMPKVNK